MLAVVAGPVLGVLMIVKVLDMGFFTAFDRPFNPVADSSYVAIGVETLRDAIGRSRPTSPSPSWSCSSSGSSRSRSRRCCASRASPPDTAPGRSGRRRRSASCWVALRLVGAPVASTSAAALAVHEVQAVQSGLQAQRILAREISRDRFAPLRATGC